MQDSVHTSQETGDVNILQHCGKGLPQVRNKPDIWLPLATQTEPSWNWRVSHTDANVGKYVNGSYLNTCDIGEYNSSILWINIKNRIYYNECPYSNQRLPNDGILINSNQPY